MHRRSFLSLLAVAPAAPWVTPFDALALAPTTPLGPVIAIEASTPLWLLEMQAYERLYATAWQARRDGTLPPTPRGARWCPTFPAHPLAS